jgi:adenylate cyclase
VHRTWRWLGAAQVVLMVALAAGVIGWWRPWAPEPLLSIAVLPFENMSGDAQQGYLADGITEDLTTALARVPGLFVISRNAAFRYKDQRIAPTQVAAELGVRYILEGSVRRVGEELRINAVLIDARDGGHLWAERFDGAWGDVFALQDKVIRQIAAALELRLLPRGQLVQGGTTVPAAYDAYLRGREYYLRFWSSTPQELAKAVPYFEQAIALDKDYGEAYAALAEVYRQASGGWEGVLGVSPREAFSKMNEYFQQASKHPSARGYRLAAYIAGLQGRFDDVTTELERAIALDPSATLNYTTMAWWLVRGGRLADSQRYMDAAVRLDPRCEKFSGDVIGMIEFSRDHFAEAAAIWERHLTMYPSDRYTRILLVAALGHLGREAEARQHYARANEYFTGNGRPPFTVLSAVLELPMKERTDAERIRDGLRKAGVPELPYGYDAASDDRLTDDEIRSLVFGRTSRARDIDSGEECLYTTTIDGSPAASCDSWTDTGSYPRLEDNVLCYWWAKSGQTCVAYFRNPGGTPEKHNEFIAITPHNRWEFSAVK